MQSVISHQTSSMPVFSLPRDGDGDDEAKGGKLLNVTVTLISMTGLHAKESSKKTGVAEKAKRKKKSLLALGRRLYGSGGDNDDEATAASASSDAAAGSTTTTTTVVASFEHTVGETANGTGYGGPGAPKTMMAHVPSLPLSLDSSSGRARSVQWARQDGDAHSKLSSFTFSRYFPMTGGNGGYEFQLCPIQMSVSRNGKLYRLGNAHVVVTGRDGYTEGGAKDVPVVNFERAFGAAMTGDGSGAVGLMRLKGDTLKCGLAERACVRVVVRVDDPSAPPPPPVSQAVMAARLPACNNDAKCTVKDDWKESRKKEDDGGEANGEEYTANKKAVNGPTPPSLVFSMPGGGRSNGGIREQRRTNPSSSPSVLVASVSSPSSSSSTGSLFSGRDDDKYDVSKQRSGVDSHTTAASTYSNILSLMSSSSRSSSDESDCSEDSSSMYSDASSDILRVISDVSRVRRSLSARSGGSGPAKSSTFNNNWTVRQMHSRLMTSRRQGGTECDESCEGSFDVSVDSEGLRLPSSPPRVKRTSFFSRETLSESGSSTWGRRLLCCDSGMGIGAASRADEEDLLLASINEESVVSMPTFDNDDESNSLRGREQSHATADNTLHTPW